MSTSQSLAISEIEGATSYEELARRLNKAMFYICAGFPIWRDLFTSVANLKAGATAPDFGTYQASGGLQTYLFDGSTRTEEVHGSFELQHDYEEGTDIDFHVHWEPTTAAAGNVRWSIEYVWKNTGDGATVPTTIHSVNAAGGTAWVTKKNDIGTITGTGKSIGSVFVFRLFRESTHVDDTYAADAALIQVGIHYKVDTAGSRQETVK